MKKLFLQIGFIARIEAKYFARYPKLFLATAVIVLVPSLYAAIYLSSVWDPSAKTGALAVALVNLDEGVKYHEHDFNVGEEVASRLQELGRFGFKSYDSEDDARKEVRAGKLAFALIIPRGFSSNAIPGNEAGGGKLVVYTSEGNNYESAAIARHFAESLGHDVNERLNERRWALVLRNAAGSQRSVDNLREGVAQLSAGAHELSIGATQTSTGARTLSISAGRLSQAVGQLTVGVKQLGTGLRSMDAQLPPAAELHRLKKGAETLATGHGELGEGLVELQGGSKRLHDGVAVFRDEAQDSMFVSASVTENLGTLANGLAQMDTGLQAAHAAQQKLADGATRLNTGVGALTGGVRALSTGIRSAVEKLPEDRQMDELAKGTEELLGGASSVSDANQKIQNGALRLAAGIDLLGGALPSETPTLDGNAEGLANSVQPLVEVDAAVQNSGSGFAPNVIPAALWLGAGIAAFLIHVRVLPRHAQFFSRPAQMLGKIAMPAAVVLLQAGLIFATVVYFLKIQVVNPAAFALTLGVASLTFLLIVFALTRAFGDAGKGLAMILLAVQLSSSGGIVPIELSGGWFADVSPWLPLTWVVRAIKASMFGAYNGAWEHPLLLVALGGLVAGTMACTVGRWRFVKPNSVRPAVDF
jgi:putative membrane protein